MFVIPPPKSSHFETASSGSSCLHDVRTAPNQEEPCSEKQLVDEMVDGLGIHYNSNVTGRHFFNLGFLLGPGGTWWPRPISLSSRFVAGQSELIRLWEGLVYILVPWYVRWCGLFCWVM